jgi:preprotein translocase subunit SecF
MWFASTGVAASFIESFFAMLVGDVVGTVLLIYIAKAVLAVMRRFNSGAGRPDQE